MTGGGTAGHVTPNIALMPALQEAGYEITYIGSYNGMEKELIEAQKIPYIGISSGKLRRYFDWKNFSDPFKVLKGYGQAISILRKLKPDVVFSKVDLCLFGCPCRKALPYSGNYPRIRYHTGTCKQNRNPRCKKKYAVISRRP